MSGYAPPLPACGVPLKMPEPGNASKRTPRGSAPNKLSVGRGGPSAATRKYPGLPTVNVALLGLVKDGGALTSRTVARYPVGPTPLATWSVNGYLPGTVGVPER